MRKISNLSRSGAIPLIILLLLFCCTRNVSAQLGEEETQSIKPVVSIATLGHQDSGKAILTAAIVRILSDLGRADFVSIDEISDPSEINVQGVQLLGAQVEYETDKVHYNHVDCRTGPDCVKLLSSRRKIFDGAILVVAATDGPMPQTREQIQLARKSGVKWVVVYVDNVNSINDPELLQLVEQETLELLTTYGFNSDTIPIIYGDSKMALRSNKGELGKASIIKLLSVMDEHFFNLK